MIADRSVVGAVEAFWNRVEAFEKRADAQFAKEFIIALPFELSQEQNIALMRQFVVEQVLARGQVADWVIHDEPGNPHVHLMTTLRPLTDTGFGAKKVAVIGGDGQPVRTQAGKIQYRLWAGEKQEFLQQRNAWLDLQNQHLALAGLDIRGDGRSYAERGIDIVPTIHIGGPRRLVAKPSMWGGAPSSNNDPIHALGYSRDELKAIVEEAENAGLYGSAHLYTDASIPPGGGVRHPFTRTLQPDHSRHGADGG
jgi:ATP-dependent exoDNAse (exonuclease V) alpha subunit